jgi:hypothetical protein
MNMAEINTFEVPGIINIYTIGLLALLVVIVLCCRRTKENCANEKLTEEELKELSKSD